MLASELFTESDRTRLNDCVRSAEARTAAEIVPVVATSSGDYERAEDLVGLAVAIATALTLTWLRPYHQPENGSWDYGVPWLHLVLLLVGMLLSFVLGVNLARRWTSLRRLLTSKKQARELAEAAAGRIFFDQRVHHTNRGTGVLVYLSLEERVAVIRADQRGLSALGQAALDGMCQDLVSRLRQGGPTEALMQTITEIGQRLAGALPRTEDDHNELPDALVTLD